MRELTEVLEAYLAEMKKKLVAQVDASMQVEEERGNPDASQAGIMLPAVAGLISEPAYIRPGLQPHLSNALRRLNDVIREQAYTEWWLADVSWELGRRIQLSMRTAACIRSVAFLGKMGSHSHRSAAGQYPEADMMPVGSFSEACVMVMDGRSDAAVLPIDNSTAGTIADVYDLLLLHDLHIVKSASLAISSLLLGVPGSTFEGVREVRTHPQPIAQCAASIARYGWKAVPMESTAVAAETVARLGDQSVAAIGSREAAALYGLEVLGEDIGNTAVNQTRFVTVMRDLRIPPDATRISLVFTVPHESGALAGVLSRLADFGLNVAKIQSRPIPYRAWEYSFHLDFESRIENPNALKALYMLEHELPYMKLLGWYADTGAVF